MANIGTASDMEGVEDIEEVVDVGVESGVAAVIEVIRVDAAGTDEVVENDAVATGEVREDALPR